MDALFEEKKKMRGNKKKPVGLNGRVKEKVQGWKTIIGPKKGILKTQKQWKKVLLEVF